MYHPSSLTVIKNHPDWCSLKFETCGRLNPPLALRVPLGSALAITECDHSAATDGAWRRPGYKSRCDYD